MASNYVLQAIKQDSIEKLKHQISVLKYQNSALKKQVVDARSQSVARETYLAQLRQRSRQRRQNKKHLVSALYWIRIGQAITAILAIILFLYLGPPAFVSSSIFDEHLKVFIAGCVGFSICIPAQKTFLAPRRVFYGTVVFGIKQIADIFLPNWCIILLPILGVFVLHLLDKDRLQQYCGLDLGGDEIGRGSGSGRCFDFVIFLFPTERF
ncbi:hypothetical protein I4U23_000230 [Adineta vaga]|nr:hypothetical protein I4U23_000230 [Adineta vaga]